MAKIVGIKDAREFKRKNGERMNAWMVFYLNAGHDVVGQEAAMQWVDADLFAAAIGARQVKDLIGRECTMVYDRRGFLESFQVA